LLYLRTSCGDRRSQRLERRGVTGISLQLRLVPTAPGQVLASAREQLGRHARRRERDAAALLEQSGDADTGGVEIEDGMEARVGLEFGEAAHQRDLGRRRPAGNPDDEIVAIGKRQQVAEGLAVLDKDDAAQPDDERELERRVRHVVVFNPYDYPQGVGRANRVASIYIGSARLPAIGPVVTRMENKPMLGIVLRGGLLDGSKLPDHYLGELRRVGRRRSYPRVAREVYRNVDSMIAARPLYGRVSAPLTLIYGDHDWSRVPAREANLALLPGARSISLADTGHFAALEQPDRVAEILLDHSGPWANRGGRLPERRLVTRMPPCNMRPSPGATRRDISRASWACWSMGVGARVSARWV
jgi:hypothetical protein